MIHKDGGKAITLSSYKTTNPGQLAAQLLQHPLVVAEIQKRFAARAEKSEVTAEFLIQKLVSIINDNEIKTTDTLRAIELAGKSIALWRDRQEISGPDGGAIETEQRVKESAADFTNKLSVLVKRSATDDNVVPFIKEAK